MHKLDTYQQNLLDGWEEVYKKSQLTLWIMFALKDGEKYMADIKEFILRATNGILSADDQSMYRALRRFHDVELVDFTTEAGDGGPDRKIYKLTSTGSAVLKAFVQRNITKVIFKPEVRKLISAIEKGDS